MILFETNYSPTASDESILLQKCSDGLKKTTEISSITNKCKCNDNAHGDFNKTIAQKLPGLKDMKAPVLPGVPGL